VWEQGFWQKQDVPLPGTCVKKGVPEGSLFSFSISQDFNPLLEKIRLNFG
jgi:hypothetical protein